MWIDLVYDDAVLERGNLHVFAQWDLTVIDQRDYGRIIVVFDGEHGDPLFSLVYSKYILRAQVCRRQGLFVEYNFVMGLAGAGFHAKIKLV